MKSYGYKLRNCVFFIAVYNLLPPLEQFVEAVFKVLFIVKGNAPHVVQKRAEKIVIHGCKVCRIQQMLKDIPFELLECGFDDLCNIRPGIVVKKYGLALSMGSFQSNSLIHAM